MSGQRETVRGETATSDGNGSDAVRVECSECVLAREVPGVDAALDLQDRHADAAGAHHILEFECGPAADG